MHLRSSSHRRAALRSNSHRRGRLLLTKARAAAARPVLLVEADRLDKLVVAVVAVEGGGDATEKLVLKPEHEADFNEQRASDREHGYCSYHWFSCSSSYWLVMCTDWLNWYCSEALG